MSFKKHSRTPSAARTQALDEGEANSENRWAKGVDNKSINRWLNKTQHTRLRLEELEGSQVVLLTLENKTQLKARV